MTQTAIAAKVHQTLDVHRVLAAQVAFNLVVAVDSFADLKDFSIRQLVHTTFSRDTDLLDDFLCELRSDPVNVAKRDYYALARRDVGRQRYVPRLFSLLPVAIRQ